MTVDKNTAERFIRASAWWLTHGSGRPVRAPGHAKRLYLHERGWAIDFGANTFLVGAAIERCQVILDRHAAEMDKGVKVTKAVVEAELKEAISGCVANYRSVPFEHYPIKGETLEFGAQGIGVDDAATFMIRENTLLSVFLR